MSFANQAVDVAVLGGGPGGYVAAIAAAQRGAQVVLVEKQRVGGTCLNVGCIPTKALAMAAEWLVRCKRASEFGVSVPAVHIDLPRLMAFKQATIDQLVGGVEQLLHSRRIEVVYGTGRVVNPKTLSITGVDQNRHSITANQLILAPGSIPSEPPIVGRDLPGVMTSTEAINIESVPTRLLVIGGGVIGLELACIYEALGSQITVLEITSSILPLGTDEVIAKRLQIMLRRRGMAIHTGITVERIEPTRNTLRVITRGPGSETVFEADRVLIATGRWPNTQDMGFEDIGLRFNGKSIAVDDHLSTNVRNVWAIGDAIGGCMLAHKAMVDGRVVAENVTGGRRQVDYRSVPSIIFTRPEVASVGLTEAEGRSQGAEVKVSQFAFSANPKARILGESDGLVRLVCEKGTGQILGAHLMGPHATDLIAELALAVQVRATADDLAWTTHAHPTLPEAVLEAALGFRDAAIHMHAR